MKYKHILLIVFIILLLDQAIKVYIKTHFYLNESVDVLGSWFKLHFIENEGMAFGMTILDAPLGKLLLSLFRLVAVSFGFYWVYQLSKKGYGKGLLICAALILAGAAGNLIDSMFYGLIFTESDPHVAQLVSFGAGYAPFLHGKVVDMFYFDLIDTTWPEWMPFVGGKNFRFFEPIFNLADAAISIGIITLLLFQKRLLGDKLQAQQQTSTLEHSSNDSSSL